MLRFSYKLKPTPTNSGLKKGAIGFGDVCINDYIGGSMWVVRSALDKESGLGMYLDSGNKLNWL